MKLLCRLVAVVLLSTLSPQLSTLRAQSYTPVGNARLVVLAPSQITSDQNNYAPTNLARYAALRLTVDAPRSITGIAAQGGGRLLWLHNASASTITFPAESASSTAANRFTTAFTLAANEVRLIVYDGTSARWCVQVGGSGSGSLADGDKGDVTVSASGATWTIDAGTVTLAKHANVATDRLLGRDTASSGAPEELTVGGGLEFSGSGGIQRSALTGDATASAGSNALTIANDAVTYAKMQNISATQRLLGRTTAAAGNTEELTLNMVLDWVSTTQGAILYRNSSGWVALAPGTAGQVLESGGAAANVAWATDDGGSLADGDKGDVTVSASGATWTVDAGTITLAKHANMATDRLLGRDTASSGVPEELSVGGGLEFSGSGGIQRSALTGDATASAGSNAITVVQASTSFATPGDISPAALSANADNYSPTNLATSTVLRLSSDASRNITGLATGADGRWIKLINVGSNPIVLVSESASSTAANRFTGGDLTLPAGGGVDLLYDATSSRWRLPGSATIDNVSLTLNASAQLQRAALTGDATASAGSNALTIANDAVTNAKAANMAQNTVKGRVTASTGDPEDLTPANVLTIMESGGTNVIVATEVDTVAEIEAIAGAVNLLVATEVDTVSEADALMQLPVEFCVAASDETTAITATTNKVKFRAPYAFTITSIRGSLTTAQASGSIFTVDVNETGTTILSTKLTIDNTETTTTTAATALVISDTAIADAAEISIDVDQVGASGASGLKVWILGYR